MDVPPTQPPPQPQRTPQPLPEPSSGCGCFGAGCLTIFIVCFLFLAALVGSGLYLCSRAINTFTSSQPADVAVEMPSDAEFQTASEKLSALRTALRNKQGATFTFTAAELNALIARHPDFASRKGKTRIAIADSIATVEMSVPLDTIEWKRMRHRWFNGSAQFGFIYADEGFRFDANWIEANGHRISSKWLNYGADAFNRSFSRGFEEGIEKEGSSDSWRNIKTMTLDEDKLVVITRGE